MRRCSLVVLIVSLVVGCDRPQEGETPSKIEPDQLPCTLSGEPTFEIGSIPKIKIEIRNDTEQEIYLVKCLYGSNYKLRYPFCSFDVTGPRPVGLPSPVLKCGTCDPLRGEDFVKVPPGGIFNPYERSNGDTAGGHELMAESFVEGAEYRIRFVYSTANQDIREWMGAGDSSEDRLRLKSLFSRVPKITVVSNEITVRAVRPKEKP
jgi:hypothetical protein